MALPFDITWFVRLLSSSISLLTVMTSAYNDNTYSDVTIKFSEREIHCHKLVLCQASDYFKALCSPDSKFVESGQGVIELQYVLFSLRQQDVAWCYCRATIVCNLMSN